jgi:hypothetical protein
MAQEQVLKREVVAWACPGQHGREQKPEEFKHVLSIADPTARPTFAVSHLLTLAAMLVLLDLRVMQVTLPAMVALGPLMVAQYLFWARRLGNERTTWQYQQAESRSEAKTGTRSVWLPLMTDAQSL